MLSAARIGLLALATGAATLAASCGAGEEPRGSSQDLLNQRASEGAPASDGDGVLRREPIPEAHATQLIVHLRHVDAKRYDPDAIFVYHPDQSRFVPWDEHPEGGFEFATNSRSLRDAREVPEAHPDLRILLVGDSHADGLVSNDETLTALLEERLAADDPSRTVEVWNASLSGYTFYNYLGVLEKHLDLEPDVFVVAFYPGNDFLECLYYRHYFDRTTLPEGWQNYGSGEVWREVAEQYTMAAGAQAFSQLDYFQEHPSELPLAAETARLVMDEIARTCAEHGIELHVLLVPPAIAVEPELHAATFEPIGELLGIGPAELADLERLSDDLLAHLDAAGVPTIDGREALAGRSEPLYWLLDHHLNVAGHAALAEALYAALTSRE